MPEVSDKHSPAVDDAMKDPRVMSDEGTHHTGRAEDGTDAFSEVAEPAEVGLRAELARFLGGEALPGDANQVRAVAIGNGATDEVRHLLEQLPLGRTYQTVQEVWDEVGPTAATQ